MNTVEHLVFHTGHLDIFFCEKHSVSHEFSAGLSVSFLFTCRFLYAWTLKTFDHIFMLKISCL